MKVRYWTALCMLGTAFAFSLDLDSMMTAQEKKITGYSSLTPEEKKHLNYWISEHFTISPDTLGHTPLSLNINIDNGRELILSDGTHWDIAPEDQKISSLWLTPFPLEITPTDSKEYPFLLHNLTTEEKVKAKEAPSMPRSPSSK